jgi:hypothetical protein
LVRFWHEYLISVALTSFFFTYFKVFLNALPDILVASTPRLLERLRGWQAFF